MVRVLRKGATSWQVRLLAPWMIAVEVNITINYGLIRRGHVIRD